MPKLVIERPDVPPETIEIAEDSVSIGRDPANTIHVDDAACSRRHCQILRISSGFEVTDLKSRNGTKINGAKKDRAVLSHGDVIEIGAVKIRFVGREETKPIPPEKAGECRLVYASGPRKGEAFPLSTDRTTIGRKESNSIVISDTMASSYHCEVTKEAGGYVLRDLGSTNGSVVNGEPVSEIALNHGARIRLGKTTFVFVDPAVADYEQTLAAQEEAEAEWGMMRDQMDFDRVKKARRASLVWVAVFLLILGGAAAFFVAKPEVAKGLLGVQEIAGVREVTGNRVDDFSFEAGGGGWQVLGEKSGSANVTAGPAHQGQSAMQVLGLAEGFTPTVVAYGKTFNVSAGTRYEVSAWARPGAPGTAACVGVEWLLPEQSKVVGEVVRTSLAPWGGGDWSEVGAVVTPPIDAQRARLVLVVMGGGSARFDDVVFRDSRESGSAPVKMRCPTYEIVLSAQSGLSVQRAGDFLLWNGGPVAVAADGSVAYPEFCARLSGSGDESKAALQGSLLAAGGRQIGVTASYTALADRLSIEYEMPATAEDAAAVGIALQVSRDYLAEGATMSGDALASGLAAGTDQEGVKKVILGGLSRRLIISSEEPFRLKLDTGRGLRLLFLGGPSTGPRTLHVVHDFTAMQQEAGRVLGLARAAKSAGTLGEAIGLYSRVIQEFPFDEVALGQATQELETLRADGEARLAKARGTYDAAKDFYDEADLAAARDDASKLAESYKGFVPVADAAQKLAAQVGETLAGIRSDGQKPAAEGMLARAKDFRASGQEGLARTFLEFIVKRFPDSDSAREAEALLK